jgi:hypothetical protein
VGFDPTTSGFLQVDLEGRRSIHAELRARSYAIFTILSLVLSNGVAWQREKVI